MEALISKKFTLNTHNLLLSPFVPRLKSKSFPSKRRLFLQFFNHRWNLDSRKPNFCSISNPPASISSNYGGWDDLKLIEHPSQSGKLKNFLVSVGIDDSKHVFMFIIGLISALAISRVKVSTILVFPASVLVFAIGFSFGFIRGGGVGFTIKELRSRFGVGNNKGIKEDNPPRVYAEKLRNSVEFFNELNDRIANLEKEMKGAMNSNFVQVGELESYHNILKNISLDIVREKNVMEASTNDIGKPDCVSESIRESVDSGEIEKKLNQKLSSKRKRDIGGTFLNIFQLFGGMFQVNSVESKANISKNISKREGMEQLNSNMVNDQIHETKIADGIGDGDSLNRVSMNSVGNMKIGTSVHEDSRNPAYDQLGDEILGGDSRNVEEPRIGNEKSVESMRNIRKLLENEEYYNQSNTPKFMNKMGYGSRKEVQVPIKSFRDQLDVGFNVRPGKVEASASGMEHKTYLEEEKKFTSSNAADTSNKNNVENEMPRFDLRETPENLENGFELGNRQSRCNMEEGSAPSSTSAMISEDVVFDRHLMDATNLLKQARECLKGKVYEERAEVVLYKSARLLSKALSMKPMSLLAVGQLGNTFLLHGELKLKISRELRTLLSTGDSFTREKMYRVEPEGHDNQVMSRDKITSTLIDVCEECEELLVEAGRKYKLALSIDGNDVRALYNWGLALSYRAQLISDIGPEAAYDADKVYLAAIDKFDAMMSKSNAYASDALFRWGMVLRQRSQLRPRYSKEKLKLLHQARRLFEDALSMDSDNRQVKEALSSCISDLSFRNS
ncbi:hypothetical protein MKW98_024705 [Papaver atlanticum]|uniref:Uncharacterized protein n=1 Tax=Papaver atlanticum TaxID=357466 RepID=A0AAD4S220_9MAGN|nr:hypothetical protein MKW98_024705 [Papaver atlanticum]